MNKTRLLTGFGKNFGRKWKFWILTLLKNLFKNTSLHLVLDSKTPVVSDCGGCGLQIVVSPDGKIGVCQAFCGEKNFFVTESFETFNPESHPFWKQWRHRSPLTNETCKSCIALGNCGGGCPYNAYRTKGTIAALDERFCIHARETTYFLIRDLWKRQMQKKEN